MIELNVQITQATKQIKAAAQRLNHDYFGLSPGFCLTVERQYLSTIGIGTTMHIAQIIIHKSK